MSSIFQYFLRYGFATPPNYNDHELYCGGFTRQWRDNGGKFKYDRISGMDPAGPLFCEDVPYPLLTSIS